MKVLLIGHNGQLGTDINLYFSDRGVDVIGIDQPDIDVCSLESCEKNILPEKPDIVINTAAFHVVDLCEDEAMKTFEVNVLGIKNVVNVCNQLDIPIMHFSTDFVFGGDKSEPYTEEDCPNPLSIYAISRLAGEHTVKYLTDKFYLVRLCGLYGMASCFGKGYNFVEMMLKMASEGKDIKVVDDQVLTPTYTKDVSEKLYELIEKGKYGVYHMTNTGSCSWYEFAREIFSIANIRPKLSPVSSEEFNSKAKRPAYSVLDNYNLRKAGIKDLRDWKEALRDYMDSRKD